MTVDCRKKKAFKQIETVSAVSISISKECVRNAVSALEMK